MSEPAADYDFDQVDNQLIANPDIPPDQAQDPEPDFEERVGKLMGMIETDPAVRDRMLCEIYIAFTDFERMTRTMALNGGPIQMLKAMLKGGN